MLSLESAFAKSIESHPRRVPDRDEDSAQWDDDEGFLMVVGIREWGLADAMSLSKNPQHRGLLVLQEYSGRSGPYNHWGFLVDATQVDAAQMQQPELSSSAAHEPVRSDV
jgi:hypothetical protein